MINIEKIKNAKGYNYEFVLDPVIDSAFVKELRKKLNMSQSMFALLMHVQKKTVEKWEQGKNPVTNGNVVAMILFDKFPELVEEFIRIKCPDVAKESIILLEEPINNLSKEKDVFTSKDINCNKNQAIHWKMQPCLQ